jgi:hypothetical protein
MGDGISTASGALDGPRSCLLHHPISSPCREAMDAPREPLSGRPETKVILPPASGSWTLPGTSSYSTSENLCMGPKTRNFPALHVMQDSDFPRGKSRLRFCCAKNMFLRVSGTLRNPPGTTTKTRNIPRRVQPQPRESLTTRSVKKEWASMTEIRFWKSCFTISNRSSDRPRFAWPP